MSEEKDTKVNFPEKYRNFSLVQAFETEMSMKNQARDLMDNLLKKTRKKLLKFPNKACKDLQENLRLFNEYHKNILQLPKNSFDRSVVHIGVGSEDDTRAKDNLYRYEEGDGG